MKIAFEIEVGDGHVYVSSPDIPGLHIAGANLADALQFVGFAAPRLIIDNKLDHLKPLLQNETV